MGTHRAAMLGIQLVDGGRSYHGVTPTTSRHGALQELRLGHAVLSHVPVLALPSLVGAQDLILVGTSVLEQFLTTVDYPGQRLVLSARGDQHATARHTALLAAQPVAAEIPFSLWGQHYMFARGGFGNHHHLNYFIDSGLVYVATGTDGTQRQACLWATARHYRHWGIDRRVATGPHFDSPHPVSLGPLEQPGQLVATIPTRHAPWSDFGGVRIDGLLSHAFLKSYTWTLDFDRHYVFRQPEPAHRATA